MSAQVVWRDETDGSVLGRAHLLMAESGVGLVLHEDRHVHAVKSVRVCDNGVTVQVAGLIDGRVPRGAQAAFAAQHASWRRLASL